MDRPNVFTDPYEYDSSDPEGYRSAMSRVGERAGGRETVVKAYEIPPGERLCPYHYEFVEEWLLILTGELELRTPAGTETIGRGELVCFPAGPDGAHQLTNRSGDVARVLMFSSGREPAVAVYPDSDKIGVWTGRREDEFMLRRADGNVGYYDGEVQPGDGPPD
ncbi:MAG TPA: cupin domain-containing protein [Solirubrobacteraceae bacterium]